jgi:putative nucleotidyltransferase with HDIG domain
MNTATILVVDDDDSTLRALRRVLRRDGHQVLTTESGYDAIDLLRQHDVAVVISDYQMPFMKGVDVLTRALKLRPDAVRIMLTGFRDLRAAQAAINQAQVSHFLLKPWDDNVLCAIVRDAVRRQTMEREVARLNELTQQQRDQLAAWNEQLEQQVRAQTQALVSAYEDTLDALVLALDSREHATAGHSRRVALYALYLALELDLPETEYETFYRGAVLHDIGKISVPDAVLCKPGKLDAREWALMRQHVVVGSEILERVGYLRPAAIIPRFHHERYDGTGYCAGLVGEDIPLVARIFTIADVYDALRSQRPYKQPMPHAEAHAIIADASGTQFDPAVVAAFCAVPEHVWDALAATVGHAQRCADAVGLCRAMRAGALAEAPGGWVQDETPPP